MEESRVESQIERLMEGEGSEVTVLDLVPDQAKQVVLRKTVSYIVCGVIFNEKEEVLMVQEAKQTCYKQWYLPAGRMEEGESLEEALRREVKEEAGFDCEPITLLLVQEKGPQWIRFIFLAKITGGSLKSPAQADQESLQAAWWDRASPLTLRGLDILRLIESGIKYQRAPWHPVTLPVISSCCYVVQRIVLTFSSNDQLWVLLATAPDLHLPTAVAVRTHAVTWASSLLVRDVFPSVYYEWDVCTLGVLGLQHAGRQRAKADGVCFNTLVALLPDHARRNEDGEPAERAPPDRPPDVENPRYRWHQVQDQRLRQNILEKMKNSSIVPMHSLY